MLPKKDGIILKHAQIACSEESPNKLELVNLDHKLKK